MLKLALPLSALAFALTACQSTSVSEAELAELALPSYWVEGAVSHVGRFSYATDTTLFEAVRIAQPLEASADLTQVQLSRPNDGEPESFVVDIAHMYETGDTSQNVLVRSGDVVFVPSADLPVERHQLAAPAKE